MSWRLASALVVVWCHASGALGAIELTPQEWDRDLALSTTFRAPGENGLLCAAVAMGPPASGVAVVGAPGESRAYVLQRDPLDGAWAAAAELEGPPNASTRELGVSIGLTYAETSPSAARLQAVVGARDDVSGVAHVFGATTTISEDPTLDSTTPTWSREASLRPSATPLDKFVSADASTGRWAVGGDRTIGVYEGSSWRPLWEVTVGVEAAPLGAVAIGPTALLAGAPRVNRVFAFSGNGTLAATLAPTDLSRDGAWRFGAAVAADARSVYVGAPGASRVYAYFADIPWRLERTLDDASVADFGRSLALDPLALIVGAEQAARVYLRSDYASVARLASSLDADGFGAAVAVAAERRRDDADLVDLDVLVGASVDDVRGPAAGACHFYRGTLLDVTRRSSKSGDSSHLLIAYLLIAEGVGLVLLALCAFGIYKLRARDRAPQPPDPVVCQERIIDIPVFRKPVQPRAPDERVIPPTDVAAADDFDAGVGV